MATLPHASNTITPGHMPARLLHLATCQQGYYTWPHSHSKAITPGHMPARLLHMATWPQQGYYTWPHSHIQARLSHCWYQLIRRCKHDNYQSQVAIRTMTWLWLVCIDLLTPFPCRLERGTSSPALIVILVMLARVGSMARYVLLFISILKRAGFVGPCPWGWYVTPGWFHLKQFAWGAGGGVTTPNNLIWKLAKEMFGVLEYCLTVLF